MTIFYINTQPIAHVDLMKFAIKEHKNLKILTYNCMTIFYVKNSLIAHVGLIKVGIVARPEMDSTEVQVPVVLNLIKISRHCWVKIAYERRHNLKQDPSGVFLIILIIFAAFSSVLKNELYLGSH